MSLDTTGQVMLYTHDGLAHADDVFACAMLTLLYPDARVIRTRDVYVLNNAVSAQDPANFFLDIGGAYCPDNRQFDHHQPQGAGWRDAEKKWPFATAGLVWKHYGRQVVQKLYPTLSKAEAVEVVYAIDMSILRYVDAADCGVKLRTAGPTLSSLIASFASPWFEDSRDQFPLVKALCQEVLLNFIKRHVGKVLARDRVRQGKLLFEGKVLVLDTCLPWSEVVAEEMPSVELVVYPVEQVRGTIWQLKTAMNEDRTVRVILPQSWAGLDNVKLAHQVGHDHALFCHRGRYLAGATTFEGILHMAQLAVESQAHVAASKTTMLNPVEPESGEVALV